VERPRAGMDAGMTRGAAELASGKGHRDENFPVASFLIAPRHRGIILAFYRFARAADDVADHAEARPDEKLQLLEEMRRTVLGERDISPEAVELRAMIANRGLTPQHAIDLLIAFSRDVTKLRYDDWDDLMDYCRFSAMPVGRFVLDVHGESRSTWAASDALCAGLQVINHLQDCARDYRNLNRVYIPLDAFSAAAIGPEALAQPRASPALLAAIAGLARRTEVLLNQARPFAGQIDDRRLAFEVSVIQRLAEDLCRKLMRRDPLCERVHHRKSEVLLLAVPATARFIASRLKRGGKEREIADERR
jgi:squalene synthase HpnC